MLPLQTTIRKAAGLPDFQFELFPLHSPLLGESMFVSFPPLSNMLKFSGSSYFIRDLISIVSLSHAHNTSSTRFFPFPLTNRAIVLGLHNTPFFLFLFRFFFIFCIFFIVLACVTPSPPSSRPFSQLPKAVLLPIPPPTTSRKEELIPAASPPACIS